MGKHRQVEYDLALNEDARALDRYLMQYQYAIQAKKILENRMRRISSDFAYRSPNFDGMPRASGTTDWNTAIIYRLSEIQDRIRQQADRASKSLEDIMNVIDFLNVNSMERRIIESKYIDMSGWIEMCRLHHVSRSTAIRHWKKGLYKMLAYPRVQEILKEYEGRREV